MAGSTPLSAVVPTVADPLEKPASPPTPPAITEAPAGSPNPACTAAGSQLRTSEPLQAPAPFQVRGHAVPKPMRRISRAQRDAMVRHETMVRVQCLLLKVL
eukprot:EG_transcript_26786